MKRFVLILATLMSVLLMACSMTTPDNPTREAPSATEETPKPRSTLIQVSLTPMSSATAIPRTSTPVPTSELPARPTTAPAVVIREFTTVEQSVDALLLATHTETAILNWDVSNRPDNANLYFEQILPEGRAINVELPRDFMEVPSSGTGTVMPVLPRGDTLVIQLRLRVADMASGSNLASAMLDIPVVNHPNGENYTISNRSDCLSRPYAASSGFEVGEPGMVMAYSLGGVALTASNGIGESFVGLLPSSERFMVLDGPFCFHTNDGSALTYRQWRVRSERTGTEGWAFEYHDTWPDTSYMLRSLAPGADELSPTPDPDPVISSFTVNPTTANLGDSVTVSWEIEGAFEEARITSQLYWHHENEDLAVVTTPSGSFTFNVPDDWRLVTPYYLVIIDPSTNTEITRAVVDLEVICPYSYFVSDPGRQSGTCPLSEPVVGEGVYQAFERGFMIWDGTRRQIFVLSDTGDVVPIPDTWDGGDVVFPEDPPPGLIQPLHGFGTVWVETEYVRNLVGWATSGEQQFTLTRQQAGLRGAGDVGSWGTIYITTVSGRHIRILNNSMSGPYAWSYLD